MKIHVESLTEGSYTGDGDIELEIQFDNVVRTVKTSYSFESLSGEAILMSEIKVTAADVGCE